MPISSSMASSCAGAASRRARSAGAGRRASSVADATLMRYAAVASMLFLYSLCAGICAGAGRRAGTASKQRAPATRLLDGLQKLLVERDEVDAALGIDL
tara:strand:- start:338 stop:634 length:297 start_codon:yes stop_codon:yes gene_type:complete